MVCKDKYKIQRLFFKFNEKLNVKLKPNNFFFQKITLIIYYIDKKLEH